MKNTHIFPLLITGILITSTITEPPLCGVIWDVEDPYNCEEVDLDPYDNIRLGPVSGSLNT